MSVRLNEEVSEIQQALLRMAETHIYLMDLLNDPDEVRRWQYVLQKEQDDLL